jgi:hypothetical protein
MTTDKQRRENRVQAGLPLGDEDETKYPIVYAGSDLSTVQVILTEEVFKAFEAWIVRQGLELSPPLMFRPDDLPSYIITIPEAGQ